VIQKPLTGIAGSSCVVQSPVSEYFALGISIQSVSLTIVSEGQTASSLIVKLNILKAGRAIGPGLRIVLLVFLFSPDMKHNNLDTYIHKCIKASCAFTYVLGCMYGARTKNHHPAMPPARHFFNKCSEKALLLWGLKMGGICQINIT